MVDKAEEELKALGLEKSLYRRYAIDNDIPIAEVLHVNRKSTLVETSIFADLSKSLAVNPREFSKVEEVGVETFIKDILPNASSVEVLLSNSHHNNCMSLLAPVYDDAPGLFAWDNNISWTYKDNITDSIKERVKSAGGTVEGELRVSLEWFNYDDLDLHVVEPNGNKIFFSKKVSPFSTGFLDVDMNAGTSTSREAVENIIFPSKSLMFNGIYEVHVNNYRKQETVDVGFGIEIECRGTILNLEQSSDVPDGKTVHVADILYDKEYGIIEIKSMIKEATPKSKEIFGLYTNKFHKVNMILLSPNYWNGQAKGNKHTFFILEGARNPVPPRGIFNEYLKPELLKHKRVFELLGNRLQVEDEVYSDNQLSGLGFSSTQRNELICKVAGNFTRTIKVKF